MTRTILRPLAVIAALALLLMPGAWRHAPVEAALDDPAFPYTASLPLILQNNFAPLDLVPYGAEWKYLDDGSDLGTAWRERAFNDSQWAGGPAPLGYGDDGEATRIHYGPDAGNKFITSYFRHAFTIHSPGEYRTLDLELHCDDGIVVYLNGTEAYRYNLPDGEINADTLALDNIYEEIEPYTYHATLDASLLTAGQNVLAVEVHQYQADSSDLGFDLTLLGDSSTGSVRFAAIGDYGGPDNEGTGPLSEMMQRWNPDLIVTLGDNNYPTGEAETIDANIGQYFHSFIAPYTGAYGPGAQTNRFFPSLGNHDWISADGEPPLPQAYLDYFTLPGNERYYDFQWGPAHFFVLDSDPGEPDGMTHPSVQSDWLRGKMLASQAEWKIVYFHTPPFNGGPIRGSTPEMDWPFVTWGADLVMSGHEHSYQRIQRYGINYIVNGAGGFGLYPTPQPVEGTVSIFAGDYGAVLVEANPCHLMARFIALEDERVIDTFLLSSPAAGCQ